MATIKFRNGEIRMMGLTLGRIWNTQKYDIKLSGKNLFYLLKLKQKLDEENTVINDAFMAIGQAHGGTLSEEGNMTIPPEEIEETNKELNEIAIQETEIEYTPITIRDDDNMPMDLMEALLPFLNIEGEE